MQLGASFSHRHLKFLGLDPTEAIVEFKKLGLRWIRLGCYWDEIEKEKGKWDFSEMDRLVDFCGKNRLNVVLTVGMKASRWPEYYIPKWVNFTKRRGVKITKGDEILLRHALVFIEKVVKRYKGSKAIKVWQVENEPMDPSGQKWWRIGNESLREEVSLVKKLDPDRKVMINLWGNELSIRKNYKKAYKLAGIVGFDFYLRHPVPFLNFFKRYVGPIDSKKRIKKVIEEIRKSGSKFWIAELQAEPWESGEIVTKKKNPPSFLPKDFRKNMDWARQLNPDVVLLWGFEYWLWKRKNGDNRYWKMARKRLND